MATGGDPKWPNQYGQHAHTHAVDPSVVTRHWNDPYTTPSSIPPVSIPPYYPPSYIPGTTVNAPGTGSYDTEAMNKILGVFGGNDQYTDDTRIENLIEMLEVQPTEADSHGVYVFEIQGKRYSLFDILQAQMQFMFRLNVLLIHRQLGRQNED